MKLDPRFDNVLSTRNERMHAEMRAREVGAVGLCIHVMVELD